MNIRLIFMKLLGKGKPIKDIKLYPFCLFNLP